MKLQTTTFKDGIFGAEKEMNFSIDDDNSIIFDILRDKMYSDKIGSLCREVMSNSRDANRESGRADKAIEVEIIEPNKLTYVSDMCIVFRDFGLGITPDRMANVFVKYAASTKRSTNSQTGGFGLGAKTPFAYTDTFSIVTVCMWEGKRMKYTYSAMIDSSRKGKMIQFDSEEVSNDIATGTQIIVPIKENDRDKFEKKSLYYSYLWKVKPNYINFARSTQFEEEEEVISGDNFVVIKSSGRSMLSGEKYILNIDGIPYPLNTTQFSKLNNQALGSGYRIILNAKVGSLTISANREAVQYDDRTKQAISVILDEIKTIIKSKLISYIADSKTYLEACRRFVQIKSGNILRGTQDPMAQAWAFAVQDGRYGTYGMFTNERDEIFDEISVYNGKKVITKLTLKHHQLLRVYSDYNGKTKYEQISWSISHIDENLPVYYLDTRKNVRRNITVWKKNPSFLLIQPLSSKSVKEINEDNYKIAYDYDMNVQFYSDVEKAEITHETSRYVPGETSTLKVRLLNAYGNWSSHTIEFHKKNKRLWNTDENETDKTKYAYVVLDSIRDPYNNIWGKKAEKLSLLMKVTGMKVIAINNRTYQKYVVANQLANFHNAYDVVDKVIAKNKDRILKANKINALDCMMKTDNATALLNFAPQLLPQSLKEFQKLDVDSIEKWKYSYIKAPFNQKGLHKKLKKIMSEYPMLKAYIAHHYLWNLRYKSQEDIKKHKKVITQYINSVA